MTCLAQERRAWRVNWRRLILLAQETAADPSGPPMELKTMADVARGWIMPTPAKPENLVCVAFLAAARAYAAQTTVHARRELAEGLAFWAARTAVQLDDAEPQAAPGLRWRADIDG